MTATERLRDAAKLLGSVRKGYAETFAVYYGLHDHNSFMARNAAEEEWAERLVMAEAEYEIAKSEVLNADRV